MLKRTLFVALLSLPLAAQSADVVILLKGAGALAYYSRAGKREAAVPVGEHPHEMVFSPDRRFLYTTDNGTMRVENPGKGGNTVSIIDIRGRRKIGEIGLGEYHRPHGIAVDPGTGHLAVTAEAPGKLLLIDPAQRKVIKTFDTKGQTPHMVTFGPGAKWAYVSNSGSATVAAIELQTGRVKLIKTGPRPEGSVLSKDGGELYVANRDGEGITVIDTKRNEAVAFIKTGKGPVRIALTPDGAQLVYALMYEKKVAFANPKRREQIDYLLLPNAPVSCNLSGDGQYAFASAEEQDTVYILSVADRKIAGEIKTGAGTAPDPVLSIPGR